MARREFLLPSYQRFLIKPSLAHPEPQPRGSCSPVMLPPPPEASPPLNKVMPHMFHICQNALQPHTSNYLHTQLCLDMCTRFSLALAPSHTRPLGSGCRRLSFKSLAPKPALTWCICLLLPSSPPSPGPPPANSPSPLPLALQALPGLTHLPLYPIPRFLQMAGGVGP